MSDLPHMSAPLQSILLVELGRGNRIASVGDWPPKCRLFVMLERPFTKRYALPPDVAYRKLNDPHYWKAEYAFQEGLEVLACGF